MPPATNPSGLQDEMPQQKQKESSEKTVDRTPGLLDEEGLKTMDSDSSAELLSPPPLKSSKMKPFKLASYGDVQALTNKETVSPSATLSRDSNSVFKVILELLLSSHGTRSSWAPAAFHTQKSGDSANSTLKKEEFDALTNFAAISKDKLLQTAHEHWSREDVEAQLQTPESILFKKMVFQQLLKCSTEPDLFNEITLDLDPVVWWSVCLLVIGKIAMPKFNHQQTTH